MNGVLPAFTAVVAVVAHGAVNAVDREESEAVGAHELAHLLHRHVGGEQVVRARRVDAVEIRVRDRRQTPRFNPTPPSVPVVPEETDEDSLFDPMVQGVRDRPDPWASGFDLVPHSLVSALFAPVGGPLDPSHIPALETCPPATELLRRSVI